MSSLHQPIPRIDSHHHVWDPARREYPFMEGLEALQRPYSLDDLAPLLAANGFDGSVAVQTVSEIEETREFLALAEATRSLVGVVGWVDLEKLDVDADLRDLREAPGGKRLVGIRHQVHDEEDPDWLLQEEVQRGLEVVAEHELTYDLLVRPRELPAAITVARDFPHLRFVVDHIAKPDIAGGAHEPWAELMHEFAGLENVACKLSGMVTEAGDGWSVEDLLPYVRTVVEIFGHDRLMFGSDWPVCTLAASYDEVVRAAREALEQLEVLTPEAETAIFGATAIHWYNLDVQELIEGD